MPTEIRCTALAVARPDLNDLRRGDRNAAKKNTAPNHTRGRRMIDLVNRAADRTRHAARNAEHSAQERRGLTNSGQVFEFIMS